MIAQVRKHTDALISVLRTGGLIVGDADHPGTEVIVYETTHQFTGSLANPSEDADLGWDIVCIGRTRYQAGAVFDKVNTVLEGVWLTVEGRSVRPRFDLGVGARPDPEDPNVFIANARYRAFSFPT